MNLIKTAFSMSYSLTDVFPCLRAPVGVKMSWTRRLPVALLRSSPHPLLFCHLSSLIDLSVYIFSFAGMLALSSASCPSVPLSSREAITDADKSWLFKDLNVKVGRKLNENLLYLG